jgi:hypothetical protein
MKVRVFLLTATLFSILFYVLTSVLGIGSELPNMKSVTNKNWNGYYYAHQLLKELEYSVQRNKKQEFNDSADVFILLDHPNLEGVDFETLKALVSSGKQVLVLDSDHAEIQRIFGITSLEGFGSQFMSDEGPLPWSLGTSGLRLFDFQDGFTAVHYNDQGVLYGFLELGQGRIYFHSIPEIYMNINLTKNHAQYLNEMIKPYAGLELYVYEYSDLSSFVQNPLKLLFYGSFLAITLHFLLLGILFAYRISMPFGSIQNPDEKRRRDITQHLRGIGELFHRNKAFQIVSELDREHFIQELCHQFSLPLLKDQETVVLSLLKERYDSDLIEELFREAGTDVELLKLSRKRNNFLSALSGVDGKHRRSRKKRGTR